MRLFRFDFVLALTAVLFLSSCHNGPAKEDLGHLQGYWEIEEVVFPDGTEKSYGLNTNIEYLQWDGSAGFRKKMQPTLEGTYLTSDDALPMEVIWRERQLFLKFSGGTQTWEEEVMELSEGKLITRHANGLEYSYKRHEPMTNL
ncbi:MAG: hypothetical protein P8X60_07000 [Robiginitalea sp.]|jgi:hypothetical protein